MGHIPHCSAPDFEAKDVGSPSAAMNWVGTRRMPVGRAEGSFPKKRRSMSVAYDVSSALVIVRNILLSLPLNRDVLDDEVPAGLVDLRGSVLKEQFLLFIDGWFIALKARVDGTGDVKADAVGCLHNEVIINADAANMVNTLFDGFRLMVHGALSLEIPNYL